MKTSTCAVLLLVFLTIDAQAQSFYAGASIGESIDYQPEYAVSNADLDRSWRIHGGWRFTDSMSLEASYHDFGNASVQVFPCPEVCIPELVSTLERDTDAWSLRLAHRFGDHRWQPFVAVGWVWTNSEIHTFSLSGLPITQFDDNDSGGTAEIGVRFLLNEGFAVRGGYEWFAVEGDQGAFNLGAEYSF